MRKRFVSACAGAVTPQRTMASSRTRPSFMASRLLDDEVEDRSGVGGRLGDARQDAELDADPLRMPLRLLAGLGHALRDLVERVVHVLRRRDDRGRTAG